jgi:DNA-binding NtrC family response regulator
MAHALIVDDEATIRRIIDRVLRERGHTSEQAESGEAALLAVAARRPDLILLDVNMGGMDGLEALPLLCRAVPGVPVVIMTGQHSVDVAVRAFKLGAVDFVCKPFEDRKLQGTIDALLGARRDVDAKAGPALVGESPRFRETMTLARKYALPDINILLEGETGTGKELFARAIHAASKRASAPFIPVDCSILSESLIESELFGHEKGSFTGANTARIGHFERADGGTLFLDEIGNLSPAFQAKLLRVLQERTLERVGGRETIKLDIRVVSATNANLRDAVSAGTFRRDLYYRLGEVTIRPPPLRDRVGDVERIAAHFAHRYATQFGLPVLGISAPAMARLAGYSWPGNVRELENAIKSAVVIAGDFIEPEHLPEDVIECSTPAASPVSFAPISFSSSPILSSSTTTSFSMDEIVERFKQAMASTDDTVHFDFKGLINDSTEQVEKTLLTAVVKEGRYSLVQLAKILKIDVKTLRLKLRKYGLD